MKKLMLKLAVLAAVSTLSTAAFAAFNLEPGTIFSVGSLTPAIFKTSPKVTIVVSGTQGTSATEWGAIAGHASAANKAKGMFYYTNNSDPGMWHAVGTTFADMDALRAVDPPTTGHPDDFVVD